jgi:flagellar basal body-associated protein FliL
MTRRRQNVLLSVGIVQILLALGLAFLMWLQGGFVRMHIVGAYSDLVRAGIIDEAKAEALHAEQIQQDPWYLPLGLLVGNELDQLQSLIVISNCTLLFAGVTTMMAAWRR